MGCRQWCSKSYWADTDWFTIISTAATFESFLSSRSFRVVPFESFLGGVGFHYVELAYALSSSQNCIDIMKFILKKLKIHLCVTTGDSPADYSYALGIESSKPNVYPRRLPDFVRPTNRPTMAHNGLLINIIYSL